MEFQTGLFARKLPYITAAGLTILLQTIALGILTTLEMLILFYVFQVTLVLTSQLISIRRCLNYANYRTAQ